MEITHVDQIPQSEQKFWTLGVDASEPVTQATAPAAWEEYQQQYKNGEGLQALMVINRLIAYDRNQPEVWRIKAKLHGALGHADCCLLAIHTLLAHNPHDLEGLRMHALYLYCHHHHDKALSICNQVLGVFPSQADFWAIKGDILHATGRPHEAAQAGKKALSINPGCSAAHRLLNDIQNSI